MNYLIESDLVQVKKDYAGQLPVIDLIKEMEWLAERMTKLYGAEGSIEEQLVVAAIKIEVLETELQVEKQKNL